LYDTMRGIDWDQLYDTMRGIDWRQLYDTIGRKKLFHVIVRYNGLKKTFSCDCTIQSTIGTCNEAKTDALRIGKNV